MTSNVLPLFWNLSSSSRDTRLSASADLISSLEVFQQSHLSRPRAGSSSSSSDPDGEEDENLRNGVKDEDEESGMEVDGSEFENGGGEGDEEGEKLDREMVRGNAEDVVYTVRRLVRGLGSSRESSRLGFAVALTELMSRIHTLLAPQILSLLIRSSAHAKSMKGPEERDALFARLFGLSAIVDSGSLFRLESSQEADFDMIVDELMTLGDVKAWLRESAWWILVQAVERLCLSSVGWKDRAVERLAERVFGKGGKGWSQEKVGLGVMVERYRPDLDWKSLLAPTLRNTPILSNGNLVALGRILKETDSNDEEIGPTTSTGSWKPQVHFVWNIILDGYFLNDPKSFSGATGQAPFQEVFRVVVDESLLAHASSAERKYWGFQILTLALPRLEPSLIPQIFTPNFMREWMRNLSSDERYLHKAAVAIAKLVQVVVKQNPRIGMGLMSTLTGKLGRPDFDRATRTKTVESIMGSLDVAGLQQYVDHLCRLFVSSNGDESGEKQRLWVIDQLTSLCRNKALPKDDVWVWHILEFLLVFGFFEVKRRDKKSKVPALQENLTSSVSNNLAAVCRKRLISCLIEVTAAPFGKVPGVQAAKTADVDRAMWLKKAFDTMSVLEADEHVKVLTEVDEEIVAARRRAVRILTELAKVGGKQGEVAKGVEIILRSVILQTYDENEEALEWLDEIISAAQRMFNLPSDKASSSASSEADEAAPIDALVDVLIALLDKGSGDLRSLTNMVVAIIAPAFTSSTIAHLVAQLEGPTDTATDTANGAVEDVGSDSEGEWDEQEQNQESDDDSASDGSDDSGDENEGSDGGDDEENLPPVDAEFRKRVAEALHVSGMDLDGGDDHVEATDEEESGDEELWDDEQMFKVDEQLAEVFRQRANSQKQTNEKALRMEALHFKSRILDLFELFTKRQSDNPLVLNILSPLLRLIRSPASSENGLASRAAGVLRKGFDKPKEFPSDVDIALATEVLHEIHEMMRKKPSKDVATLCSIASLFVMRTIDAATPETNHATTVLDEYRETLNHYMSRNTTSATHLFVLDFIKRHPIRAWPLASDICAFIEPRSKVSASRQKQAYAMLECFSQHLGTIFKSAGEEAIAPLVSRVATSAYAVLDKAAFSSETKADGLKDVTRFLLHFARTSKKVFSPETYMTVWQATKLEEVIIAINQGEKTKGIPSVKGMLHQLHMVVTGSQKGAQGEKKQQKATKGESGGKRKDSALPNGDAVAEPAGGEARNARTVSGKKDKQTKAAKKAKKAEEVEIDGPAGEKLEGSDEKVGKAAKSAKAEKRKERVGESESKTGKSSKKVAEAAADPSRSNGDVKEKKKRRTENGAEDGPKKHKVPA